MARVRSTASLVFSGLLRPNPEKGIEKLGITRALPEREASRALTASSALEKSMLAPALIGCMMRTTGKACATARAWGTWCTEYKIGGQSASTAALKCGAPDSSFKCATCVDVSSGASKSSATMARMQDEKKAGKFESTRLRHAEVPRPSTTIRRIAHKAARLATLHASLPLGASWFSVAIPPKL